MSTLGPALRANYHVVVISFVTAVSLVLHVINLNAVMDSDEYFYRTAALTILNHASCGTFDTLASLQTCNLEHPPLAKLLMAMSMAAFGNGNLGVRLPSIVAGVSSIPAVAWLASSLSGGNKWAIVAAGVLLSTSPTWFLLSSVGMLDSLELFFGILGLAICFSRFGSGRGGIVLSGVILGFAILSKEEGFLILAGLIAYGLLIGEPRKVFYVSVWCLVTVVAVLWPYDLFLTPFTNPFQHVQFILETGLRLRYQGGSLASPLEWFFQPRDILLSLIALVWIPATVVAASTNAGDRKRLSNFSLIFLTSVLVPLVLLFYIDSRQEYLFYEVQVIPPLVLGAARLLAAKKIPYTIAFGILLVSTILFAYFLPSLRSIYD